MSAFDKNEKTIYDALSQITVDASKIKGKVQSRLHEDELSAAPPRRARWSMSAAAAIAIAIVLVSTATAAALGGFDWFIQKFNPAFGELVEPVGLSCEDQGIRMEIIGAQKYGNMAVVYLSLQDISGQNRLTEQTDFRDGFDVELNSQGQGTDGLNGLSWYKKVLYFDKATNTVYYEFNITSDSNSPISDMLEVSSFLVYFDIKNYEDEPVSVSLSNIGETKTLAINEDMVWGGSNLPDDRSIFTEALTPGHYAALPHGEDDQWISNIGIVDGKLHVQTGKIFHKEFGSSDASLSLMAPNGELIECDYALRLFGDNNHQLLGFEENDYPDAAYKYEEFVFSVDTEKLDGYTLCYSGLVSSGAEGQWRVAANLSDTSQQVIILTDEISVEGYLFEHVILSPLGLQLIGSCEGDDFVGDKISLAIETADGTFPLESVGASQNSHMFNLDWSTDKPLDITTVTAVVINDTRVPVK